MAIALVYSPETAYRPQIFCDDCGGRIHDAVEALISWHIPEGEADSPSPRSDFKITHRRDCDQNQRDVIEEATSWMGLVEFLDSLNASVIR